MPSKFYGIAAASRPTIFIGSRDGEIARILQECGCGFTVTPGDGEALMEGILALAGDRDLCASMGARARVAFERQWDKEQALAEWEALLQATGSPGLQPSASGEPAQRVRLVPLPAITGSSQLNRSPSLAVPNTAPDGSKRAPLAARPCVSARRLGNQ